MKYCHSSEDKKLQLGPSAGKRHQQMILRTFNSSILFHQARSLVYVVYVIQRHVQVKTRTDMTMFTSSWRHLASRRDGAKGGGVGVGSHFLSQQTFLKFTYEKVNNQGVAPTHFFDY